MALINTGHMGKCPRRTDTSYLKGISKNVRRNRNKLITEPYLYRQRDNQDTPTRYTVLTTVRSLLMTDSELRLEMSADDDLVTGTSM